jgi:bile acid:Na+ symporter, BASS family
MVLLAGSSVVMAPLLLFVLLPLTTGGADLHVDPLSLLEAIMATQLLPLCFGLAVSYWRPVWAARWLPSATAVGKVLNAATLTVILASYFPRLLQVRLDEFLGMLILLGVSIGAGWSAGGRRNQDCRAVALTTSIRNVGLGLVIASSSFAGTPVVTTVLIYGLMQLVTSFLLALRWRRGASPMSEQRSGRARTQ